MQTEERSTCPSCGGENPKAAAFCWRCYAALSPTTRMPAPPSMPAPMSMPAATAANVGPSMLARLLVGAAVSLVVAFGARTLLHHGPSLPDVVAGTPRVTTQAMKDFEKEMVENGKRSDLDVAAGAYGSGGVPAFVVLLVEGRSVEGTDAIFDEFVAGMASGGATVDTNATSSGQHAGVDYRCVPVVAPQIEAAACMWRDDGGVGIVFRLNGGTEETRDLLFRTYDELN